LLVSDLLADINRFTAGTVQSDDITMLVCTNEKVNNEPFSFELQNNIEQLVVLQQNIERFCQQYNLPFAIRHALEIALEEIFTNIVNYAFPDDRAHHIQYCLFRSKAAIKVEIRDDGRPFDPTKVNHKNSQTALEKREVGGWGLQIVQNFIDDIHYQRKNKYNILILTKKIAD
jgi:anti-sigma regulatory factor (Ser/Thr protein kinase)